MNPADHPFNDFIRAVADLAGAIAWPLLVLVLIVRYKDKVEALADRVREVFGAKFDPPLQQQLPAPARTVEEITDTKGELEHVRTPVVKDMEVKISGLPILKDKSVEARLATVTTLAAKAVLVNIFERADVGIWASQLRLLERLNSESEGLTTTQIADGFYDPAKKAYPDWFGSYPLEGYLGFLVNNFLVERVGDRVKLTPHGAEYLRWRLDSRRPPRTSG